MYRVLSLVIIVSRTLKFDKKRTTTKISVVFNFYTCCFSTFLNCHQQPAKTLLLPLAKKQQTFTSLPPYFSVFNFSSSIFCRKTKNFLKNDDFCGSNSKSFSSGKIFKRHIYLIEKKYLLNLKITELLTEIHTKTNIHYKK